MTLNAQIELARDAFRLSVDFTVPDGTVLGILGPNGSGKSTVLGCLAGLVRPHRASITLAGRTLAGDRVDLPAHARGVGLLSQDPLLFPHQSAVDNVAFSPRSKGLGRRRAHEVARRWLAEVDAEELAARKPGQLSGGQAQRVAVARALAGEPDLLLLDEPFAALDVHAAPAIRGLLRRVLGGGGPTTVLVTHDPLDALALADHVIVLADGRIVERGPTRELLAAPRTAFTARIAGLNLVTGTAVEDGLRTVTGDLLAGTPAADATEDAPAVAVFAPSSVTIHPYHQALHGTRHTTVDATVSALEPYGPVVRVRMRGEKWAGELAADLLPEAVAELAVEPGAVVTASINAKTVVVYPAAPS